MGESAILSARRAFVSLGAGAAVAAVAVVLGVPDVAPLAGWVVAATTILVWVWRTSWPQGEAGTKRLAEAEAHTRSTDTWVLLAAVASLAAVVWTLVRSSGQQDPQAVAAVILSVLAVLLSWALVNTVFALKYARLYYLDTDGGITFNQPDPPAYSDFAYLAFTIGMAFAMADNEPNTSEIRKVVLAHSLLSYAFGTGVLAVAINLVTNLGQS
ncbi:DUF1345 domain-containing protein [Cryptosporangium phraense]|uniref:DUF1345 domain-containing protein n=1 Tax=Cryptosporangium phraense TaxID=2593070 RepID=A0A545AQ83_9ACTN|nr:DUF1345 domain-containing protein [Cryptosporangium phraense]TQS43482.1 DUF1345 domain-containing protein [Cryptosporangium phraense]